MNALVSILKDQERLQEIRENKQYIVLDLDGGQVTNQTFKHFDDADIWVEQFIIKLFSPESNEEFYQLKADFTIANKGQ